MNLKKLEKEIQTICEKEKIYCLANFDNVKFDDENALGFLSLIRKTRESTNEEGNFDLLTHDLINSVSSDIKFSIANAFLYFPHANNFLNELRKYSDGQKIPTYFMTIEDKRFFFYVNTAFEKLYIFWDRIGDILFLAFQLNLPEDRVYFNSTIRELGTTLESSESGNWLRNFHDNEYSQILNRLRIKIVHYRQKDTYFYTEWLKYFSQANTDPGHIAQLQKEKEELLPLLKHQLDLANEGFEKTIRFIAEKGISENKD